MTGGILHTLEETRFQCDRSEFDFRTFWKHWKNLRFWRQNFSNKVSIVHGAMYLWCRSFNENGESHLTWKIDQKGDDHHVIVQVVRDSKCNTSEKYSWKIAKPYVFKIFLDVHIYSYESSLRKCSEILHPTSRMRNVWAFMNVTNLSVYSEQQMLLHT